MIGNMRSLLTLLRAARDTLAVMGSLVILVFFFLVAFG